jgi:hypothetical protein
VVDGKSRAGEQLVGRGNDRRQYQNEIVAHRRKMRGARHEAEPSARLWLSKAKRSSVSRENPYFLAIISAPSN